MRNKAIAILIILIIIVGCIVGVLFMIDNTSNEDEAEPITGNNVSQLRSTVYSDYLSNSIVMNGVVINTNEEGVYTISEQKKENTTAEILFSKYDEVNKGDTVFRLNGKNYITEVKGKIVDITESNDYISVSILDYDSLVIDAKINYYHLGEISIGTKMTVCETNPLSDKNKYKEKVKGIGFEVSENMVDLYLSNSKNFLPGTEVNVEFEYKQKETSCYVLKQMIMQDATDTYVYVEQDNNRIKRSVEIGKEFSTVSDGTTTEFVEILSGVSEGEKLVVDVIEE